MDEAVISDYQPQKEMILAGKYLSRDVEEVPTNIPA
jgi:hypothetical protein